MLPSGPFLRPERDLRVAVVVVPLRPRSAVHLLDLDLEADRGPVRLDCRHDVQREWVVVVRVERDVGERRGVDARLLKELLGLVGVVVVRVLLAVVGRVPHQAGQGFTLAAVEVLDDRVPVDGVFHRLAELASWRRRDLHLVEDDRIVDLRRSRQDDRVRVAVLARHLVGGEVGVVDLALVEGDQRRGRVLEFLADDLVEERRAAPVRVGCGSAP